MDAFGNNEVLLNGMLASLFWRLTVVVFAYRIWNSEKPLSVTARRLIMQPDVET